MTNSWEHRFRLSWISCISWRFYRNRTKKVIHQVTSDMPVRNQICKFQQNQKDCYGIQILSDVFAFEWVEAGVRLNIPKRFIYSNMDIRAQRNQTINDYWGIKIDKDNLSLDLQHFNSSPPLCFNQLINLVECSIYVYFWFCFLPGT